MLKPFRLNVFRLQTIEQFEYLLGLGMIINHAKTAEPIEMLVGWAHETMC